MNTPEPATPFDQEFGLVADMIRLHAQRDPGHPALIDVRRTLDYGGLDALMDRIAAALQRDGVRPQEAIAVCASASVEYAALFLGALRAGVVVAPLAPSETAKSLAGMLADANDRAAHLDVWDALIYPFAAICDLLFGTEFRIALKGA